jgi:MoxR-like ATPase
MQWHIKSTTKAQQGLYEYDAVSRLRDSQLGDEKVKDISNYIVKGVLWQAFEQGKPSVILIDEVDKADIEFPNDLLRELDRMEFHVYETRQTVRAAVRPIVIITPTTRRSCPTPSCAAASSTTSSFPTRRPWGASSTCISPT